MKSWKKAHSPLSLHGSTISHLCPSWNVYLAHLSQDWLSRGYGRHMTHGSPALPLAQMVPLYQLEKLPFHRNILLPSAECRIKNT